MSIKRRVFMYHRRIADPNERGLGLAIVRMVLTIPALLYALVAGIRNTLYNIGWKRVHKADVPVISIGNITAGGTGKTPVVEWAACILAIHKHRPAILSRGYGTDAETGVDDENEMLSRKLPEALIFARPDRVRSAVEAAAAGADVIILDDGFQHRRLGRDLDIVLLDATQPFGGRWMLPRGSLREPLSGLSRADHVVLTRCDLLTRDELDRVVRRVERLIRGIPITCCSMAADRLRPLADAPDADLAELANGPWAAFCGIGNPNGFLGTLRRAGCQPESFIPFADHEPYSRQSIATILQEAHRAGCRAIVCTEKDAVKVEHALPSQTELPFYALDVKLAFSSGRDTLVEAMLGLLNTKP